MSSRTLVAARARCTWGALALIGCSTVPPRFATYSDSRDLATEREPTAAEGMGDPPISMPPLSRDEAVDVVVTFFRDLATDPPRIKSAVTHDARLKWDGRVRPLDAGTDELRSLRWDAEARLLPFDPGSVQVETKEPGKTEVPRPSEQSSPLPPAASRSEGAMALVTVPVDSGDRQGPWQFLLVPTNDGLKIREIIHSR